MQGLTKSLSQWRALTAYIRSDSPQDQTYLAERDHKIARSVQTFNDVFQPWFKTRYGADERTLALTTIFQEATKLGIFLVSQPQELAFRWPEKNEIGAGRLALHPALVKLTDEHGQRLSAAQTVISASFARL